MIWGWNLLGTLSRVGYCTREEYNKRNLVGKWIVKMNTLSVAVYEYL